MRLLSCRGLLVRLHLFVGNGVYFHTHGGPSVAIGLWGGYVDCERDPAATGKVTLRQFRAPFVRRLDASVPHRVGARWCLTLWFLREDGSQDENREVWLRGLGWMGFESYLYHLNPVEFPAVESIERTG